MPTAKEVREIKIPLLKGLTQLSQGVETYQVHEAVLLWQYGEGWTSGICRYEGVLHGYEAIDTLQLPGGLTATVLIVVQVPTQQQYQVDEHFAMYHVLTNCIRQYDIFEEERQSWLKRPLDLRIGEVVAWWGRCEFDRDALVREAVEKQWG